MPLPSADFDPNSLPDVIRIGTRNSPLALAQAEEVKRRIEDAWHLSDYYKVIEICGMSTEGDRTLDRNLSAIGGKGLFTEEIETKLISGEIHVAVHSMKDMPVHLPESLHINCILPREDVRDAFISRKYPSLHSLPEGAVIGTSSSRRATQIKIKRPDITITNFRGNVQTRLQKLEAGTVDATFLAVSGLKRLRMERFITEYLDPEYMIPAISQGAIGVESSKNNKAINSLLAAISDTKSHEDVSAERTILEVIGGDCTTPIAVYTNRNQDGTVTLTSLIASMDARHHTIISESGYISEISKVARTVGKKIRLFANHHNII